MTGLQKTLLFGGVAAATAGAAAALYLSNIKKNLETVFGLPSIFGLISNRYVRITIPADIYNYSGKKITLKRFRIRVKYIDAKGNEILLGISPTVIPSIDFTTDIKNTKKFDLDIDPTVVFSLKASTPIRIYTEFSWFGIPVSIPVDMTINDIIPIGTVGNAISTLLAKIGINLKLSGLGCACERSHPLPPLPSRNSQASTPAFNGVFGLEHVFNPSIANVL